MLIRILEGRAREFHRFGLVSRFFPAEVEQSLTELVLLTTAADAVLTGTPVGGLDDMT